MKKYLAWAAAAVAALALTGCANMHNQPAPEKMQCHECNSNACENNQDCREVCKADCKEHCKKHCKMKHKHHHHHKAAAAAKKTADNANGNGAQQPAQTTDQNAAQ